LLFPINDIQQAKEFCFGLVEGLFLAVFIVQEGAIEPNRLNLEKIAKDDREGIEIPLPAPVMKGSDRPMPSVPLVAIGPIQENGMA
jgi:hypothetical protein